MLAGPYKRMPCFLWGILFVFSNVSHAISVKSYSYDKYGNVQEITDPRGFTTQYRYGLLNSLEEIDYPDHKKIKYSYDLNGVRTKMEDDWGATLFEPDEFGRINKVTFPDGQTVSYRYDIENNLIKLVYPDGTEVEYAYDLSSRLEAVKDSSGTTKFEYDELSNALRKKTLPNGITTEYQYCKTRKISNVIHKKADGNLIEEFRYLYDKNDNRTKIEKISPEGDSYVIYTYDKLNRVVKAEYSDGFFESFSYDGSGNRLSKTTPQGVIIYEYDEENRLRKAGDITYAYDLAGNLIEKSSPEHKSTYKYDFNNRPIFYSNESNQVVFEYDGDGNRISKTVNGVRTDYVNDLVAPVSQVLLKRVQSNQWKGEKTTRYVYGGSRISQSSEGRTQFYLCDSMGRNVSALVSFSGKVLNSYEYGAFGGSLSEEEDVSNVYKYCGEQFDEETGLIFLRNRYYDPEIGRFISKDPRPGSLDRPATLNPYCYVENNPVNFIDPLGFEAVNPEKWERVRLHINDLGGWFGGQGAGGHVFLEFPDRNLFLGNYPKQMETYDQININANTTTVEYFCEPSKVTSGIAVMRQIPWTLSHNCVYTAVQGMKEMGFIHADKIELSKILPLPSELRSQMLEFHGLDPRIITYPREKMEIRHPPPEAFSSDFKFFSSLDFGGVSLSKTAELQLNISDIAGAAFDPVTGQIILFGSQDRYLPSIDLDDLAVAVKSVYGIEINPQDPGISIDHSPDTPGLMKVRYDGVTADTAFGQSMFEADYLLKGLVIGKNKATGQPFNLDVPGYSSVFNRLAAYRWTGGQLDLIRFWFMPDQITLVETEDHKGMVFSDVRMKVLTEAFLKGLPTDHPACLEFANHFTTYYDEFAKQFPILEKLKNLGKITAIVKWLRENNISFDTSFFTNYQPRRVETPNYVPPIESAYQWTSKQFEKHHVPGHKHKKKVEVAYTHTIPVSGGIIYNLNSQNFATYTHPTANEFARLALTSRPSENDFSWSFDSSNHRETLIAIAQSVYRTRKPGNVKKSYTDMTFSVPGKQKLSLRRFYNSFSEKESPFGHGWRMVPYELELPAEKTRAVAQNGQECLTYPMILVRTPEGEDFYQLYMFNDDNLPILKSPINAHFLQDNLNGTFTLFIPYSGRMDFDSQGRLLKTLDVEGFEIEYQFDGSRLIAIRHQDGTAILLEYEDNRVIKVLGPGNTIVQYAYHNGQLVAMGDANKIHMHYSYDLDKRLDRITDHLGNVLFEAEYDAYNRASVVREGCMKYQSDFSLEKKTMKITDNLGRESILQFDDKNRLIHQKDFFGNVWGFAYEQDNINLPTKVIDPKGGVTHYRYNCFGNLAYLKNPAGAEWKFIYDFNGNLIAQKEPNGRMIVSMYDSRNRPYQTFLKASMEIDENECFSLGYRGLHADGRYAVYFHYDAETGQLRNRKNAKGAEISFTYHKNGQLKEVIYPNGYVLKREIDEKGNVREISDGFGIYRSYDYDEADRIKTIQTAAGITDVTYDDSGNLKLILDPRGFTTSYSYDSQHNLKEVADGEDGISSYEYNSFNQLIHLTLPNGSCKTIEYDFYGRLLREIWGQ